MQKGWKWFFIGRLAIMLAFTPEVRVAEATAPKPETLATQPSQGQPIPQVSSQEPAQVDERFARLATQQAATLAMSGRF